jgi:hypothetical protein
VTQEEGLGVWAVDQRFGGGGGTPFDALVSLYPMSVVMMNDRC